MNNFEGSNARASSGTSRSTRSDSADEEETTSVMDYPSCTEWTDEKHSLYLKSMEASFVDQLYNSLGLLQSQSRLNVSNSKSFREMHHDAEPPPGQKFKVLHGGFWKGVDFQRHTNENEGKRIQTSYAMQEQDLSSCREEVSDQNFVDEEINDERRNSSKRMKLARNNPMNDDQVVLRTESCYGVQKHAIS